jgi:CSLREA domain-containing protein
MIGTKTEQGAKVKALAFGFLVAALMVVMLLAAKPAHADTLTVNSTGDAGDLLPGNDQCHTGNPLPGPECTLRAAIEEANANDNNATVVDAINFNIGGSSVVKTISPMTGLPIVTEPVIIDGYTQPGASENTLAVGNNAQLRIRLDGINMGGTSRGLFITANGCVVRGLSITRFSFGIDIDGADNNTIEGNFVGITPGGKDMGNGSGLSIRNASGNTVGGKFPRARNIISGNGPGSFGSTGVSISFGTGNRVMGNYIGTTKSGTGNLGNTNSGVFVLGSGNIIGDNDTSDGLTNAANIIAFNGFDGVDVSGNTSTGNSILSNSIFSNGGLGINLGNDGVTPNDPGDADTGANNLQNFPVLSSAKTGRRATTIKGTLESTQNGTFSIQFFSSPKSTNEEGKKFIGQKTATTDAGGQASFTFKPEKKVKAGMFVTSTATNDATGDTSEFSAPRKVRE